MSDDDDGIINAEQMRRAKAFAARFNITLDEAVVQLYFSAEAQKDLARYEAAQHAFDFVDISVVEVPLEVLELIPASVAREHVVIPVGKFDIWLGVAMTDPHDFMMIDRLLFMTNFAIIPIAAPRSVIEAAISRCYTNP